MSALQAYIDGENKFRRAWNFTASGDLKMPTNSAEAHEIIQNLECDLSPENLTCDGEVFGDALRIKSSRLEAAYNEAINLNKGFEGHGLSALDYWNAALDHSGVENMTAEQARNYCEKNNIEPYLIRDGKEDDGLRERNKL